MWIDFNNSFTSPVIFEMYSGGGWIKSSHLASTLQCTTLQNLNVYSLD